MDLTTLRSLSTVLVFIAFIGVCWWAFSPSRKKGFKDAANLPFADDKTDAETKASDANKKPLHPKSDEERQD